MNFSIFKEILPKDDILNNFINKKYGKNIVVKYSNTGFTIVDNNKDYVEKYYISDSYIRDIMGIFEEFNLFEKEKYNYELFFDNNILIPKYLGYGEEKIGEYIFKYAKLENIRKKYKKVNCFSELDINKFVEIIYKIHTIKSGYIHGNIHPFNFYINENGVIGVFNLTSFYKGFIEEDISKICYGFDLKISHINEFIRLYGIDKINLKMLILKLYDSTKLYKFNKKDFIKLVYTINSFVK